MKLNKCQQQTPTAYSSGSEPASPSSGGHDFEIKNRTLELHSPDGVHSCVLRAADTQEAAIWFNTLHSALHVLTMKALHEANRILASLAIELHHIGWLARRPITELKKESQETRAYSAKWAVNPSHWQN
ncbi:structural molecule activity protein [Homalodisca vitripennis]|nr:structural molecule activity protein [Homalodisca vitripennis]